MIMVKKSQRFQRQFNGRAIVIVLMFLAFWGCTQQPHYDEDDNLTMLGLDERVAYLREKHKEDPDNLRVLIRLREEESVGARFYAEQGLRQKSAGEHDHALQSFQAGLNISPNDLSLKKEYEALLDLQELMALKTSASEFESQGKYTSALKQLKAAKQLHRTDIALDQQIHRVEKKLSTWKRNRHLIDLKFNELDIKNAFKFVAKTFGVSVIFDASVKESHVSLDLEQVPFVDAINTLSQITNNAYKVVNPSTLLVFANTKDRRNEYDGISIETFRLETAAAKDMAAILKGALGLKSMTINEASNALIIKDKRSLIELARKLVEANDVSPGEVILDVEIMEINLSKTERIGINYGNYSLSTTTPSVPLTGSIIDSISESTNLSIPSISLSAFKQAVDAKSLAQPSIRVLDGEKAKIHIGDRVPLRKSSIQDATGQTRTTFEYQEIGIRFNVEANIHSENQVTVRVELEVSTLGENLGTATEQAFRIGTRNADTTMLISSGETAILGGLLREEGRSTDSRIKGLGESSFLRRIFGNEEKTNARTDLLLTITPHVIRHSHKKAELSFYAGTESHMMLDNAYSELDKLQLSLPPKPALQSDSQAESPPEAILMKKTPNLNHGDKKDKGINIDKQTVNAHQNEKTTTPILLGHFSDDQYEGEVGGEAGAEVELSANIPLQELTFSLSSNANILELLSLKSLDNTVEVKDVSIEKGFLSAKLIGRGGQAFSNCALTINTRGVRRGTSFLSLQLVDVLGAEDQPVTVKAKRAKFIVR